MTPDIRPPDAIDAAWLDAVLAYAGVEARVDSFTAKKVGTGQIGDCVRFHLSYARASADAPTTLVGKFPAAGAESRATGVALGNYHREVKFYQVLQARARIATPRCYFTEVDEATHDFVLMMGDLAPAEQGDQLAGVSLAQARVVLREAAKLHAAYWEDRTLESYPWVSGTPQAPNPVQPEIVSGLWAGFVQRYGARVTPAARRIGDALCADLARYDAFRAGVRCLTHNDFRPDNMLFSQTPAQAPVTVVDWQSFAFGPGAADIGYFIAGALDPAVRRAEESALLDVYLGELDAQGVGAYPPDQLKRHYVAGAYQHFLTAFFAAMLVTQTERGDAMFFRMLDGAVDLILDHGADRWFD
ncbi:MAG: phosphotransferase [Hyphomonadaceae bacterium]|nr:phosphotransferase [Hyphomonadaceae bacterium]